MSSFHHVENEIDVYELWKILESMFEQKTVGNENFLFKKLVNLESKEGISMIDHLNAF